MYLALLKITNLKHDKELFQNNLIDLLYKATTTFWMNKIVSPSWNDNVYILLFVLPCTVIERYSYCIFETATQRIVKELFKNVRKQLRVSHVYAGAGGIKIRMQVVTQKRKIAESWTAFVPSPGSCVLKQHSAPHSLCCSIPVYIPRNLSKNYQRNR